MSLKVSINHPSFIHAFERATATNAGGRPEYGVVGEALLSTSFFIHDIDALTEQNESSALTATDGSSIFISHRALHQSISRLEGLILAAGAVKVAAMTGHHLLSRACLLAEPDEIEGDLPGRPMFDPQIDPLFELMPLYGSGDELTAQAIREHARAMDLVAPPRAHKSRSYRV